MALHFKSKEGYRKWLAHNWLHEQGVMGKEPHQSVMIGGKKHKVKHE